MQMQNKTKHNGAEHSNSEMYKYGR